MRNLLFDGIPHTEFKHYKNIQIRYKISRKTQQSASLLQDAAACASLSKIFTISNSASYPQAQQISK